MLTAQVKHALTGLRRGVPRLEAGALITGLVSVLGFWGFIELADEVREGDTEHFDQWVMGALRHGDSREPIGPDWLIETGLNITALGGVAVLTLVLFLAISYLALQRKYHAMWLVLFATLGGHFISSALKMWVGRPRPDEMLHLAEVNTASFPSGHSMLSAVVYLTLGALLASVEARRRTKAFLIFAALLITFLVGISRVYIGVHYPTDVLAGWSAGLAWALLCWGLARFLQRRGKVENDGSMLGHRQT